MSAATPWPAYFIEQCVHPDVTHTGQKSDNRILHIPKCSTHIAHTYFGPTIQNMSNIRNIGSPVFSHAVRTEVEAAQDLTACESIIVHSHYTTEYRRRRCKDRTERQDHDSDNADDNDSFQDNNDDNSHPSGNDNFEGNDNFDDNDNKNAHLNGNDNFNGNDVNDNDNLDGNDSIVTESEQEYFLNFSRNDQRNQDGGAAGPPDSK